MSPLALALLRRVAAAAILGAILLALGPPLLTRLGVLGPTPSDEIEAAARAARVAREYGADAGSEPLQAAERELARARDAQAAGATLDARHAARAAREHAVRAQRAALAGREAQRGRAEAVVGDLDRLLNDLEDVYAEVTPGLPQAEVERLLSRMKAARQAGAGLFLAYEEQRYGRVIDGEDAAKRLLVATRQALMAARAAAPPRAAGKTSGP